MSGNNAGEDRKQKREKLLLGNPMELASVVRDQTLIVQNGLSRAGASEEDMTHPLKIYSSFSRFIFAIIKDKSSVTANIKATDMPGIFAASDYAYRVHMDELHRPKSTAKKEESDPKIDELLSGIAFTTHIPGADFMGASPAAYLINSQNKKEDAELLEAAAQIQKYHKYHDAMLQALELYKAGKLAEKGQLVQKFKEVDMKSLPFTKRITAGKLKGKTPVEVILQSEDPEASIQLLKNQYSWLSENLKKNPKYASANKEQMSAISEAILLYRDGKLRGDVAESVSQSASGKTIPIFTGGFRPLRNRPQVNGKTFVYEAYISWDVGAAYPVGIEVKNYYATVNTKPDGTMNVMASTKEGEKRYIMALSVEEWMNIIYIIQANMRTFEQLNASACYRDASRLNREAKEAAKTTQEANREAS